MTQELKDKISRNEKLTKAEIKILVAEKKAEAEQWKKDHPTPPAPVPEKSYEQKIIDGDIETPPEMKVINGEIVYKTPAELYADKIWSAEKYAEYQRAQRDTLLRETDKYLLNDFPITAAGLKKIKEYRQALRDLPQAKGWPEVKFPPLPEIEK